MRHVTLISNLENIMTRTPCIAVLSDRGEYEERIEIDIPRRAVEVEKAENLNMKGNT
jgi:hypothetical protein